MPSSKEPKSHSTLPPSPPSTSEPGSPPTPPLNGDSDRMGPQMKIFSDAAPPRWRQALMGFKATTSMVTQPHGKLKPREDYVRMWLTCEPDLLMARLGGLVTRVEKILEGLEGRETRFVRAGTARRRVDDMLEYAVRLATGARVLQDEDAAFRILFRVARGSHPRDKINTAYNLLCYIHKKYFCKDATLENLTCLLMYGDMMSASSGGGGGSGSRSGSPMSHCGFSLAHFFAPLKDMGPYTSFKCLWEKYNEYREENGLMLPGQKKCFVCGIVPERRRDLKRCAGCCLIPRKPVYCGTKCQKKHWPTHKKWCSREFKVTESDIESEECYCDYTDCDSEDDYDFDDEEDSSYYSEDEEGSDYEDPSPKDQRTDVEDMFSEGYNASAESGEDEDEEDEDEGEGGLPGCSHPENCSCQAKDGQSESGSRSKSTWKDEGNYNFDRLVLDTSLSVIRLRNA